MYVFAVVLWKKNWVRYLSIPLKIVPSFSLSLPLSFSFSSHKHFVIQFFLQLSRNFLFSSFSSAFFHYNTIVTQQMTPCDPTSPTPNSSFLVLFPYFPFFFNLFPFATSKGRFLKSGTGAKTMHVQSKPYWMCFFGVFLNCLSLQRLRIVINQSTLILQMGVLSERPINASVNCQEQFQGSENKSQSKTLPETIILVPKYMPRDNLWFCQLGGSIWIDDYE